MPTAAELTDELIDHAIPKAEDDEGRKWLSDLQGRLQRIKDQSDARINVEQLFDYAKHDAEMWKMRQGRCPLGRWDGCTPWGHAQSIESILHWLEKRLPEFVFRRERYPSIKLKPIVNFAQHLTFRDWVITFNYDTLLERALSERGINWCHGLADMSLDKEPVVVLKMHGSVDWFICDRRQQFNDTCTFLFRKENADVQENDDPPNTNDDPEWHMVLWRANVEGGIQTAIDPAMAWSGLTGLGSYKPLHNLPGSGWVWDGARGALLEAEEIYIIGFSLSPFDGMARLTFSDIMHQRKEECRLPSQVRLVDPSAVRLVKDYESVFRCPITIDCRKAQCVNWGALLNP